MNETQVRLRRVLRGRLESLERAGVQQLPKARVRVASIEAPAVVAEVEAEVEPIAVPPVALESLAPAPTLAFEPIMQEAPMAKTAAATKRADPSGRSRGDGALFEEPAAALKVPASAASTLEVLRQEVVPCTRCHELATTRTQTVFGVGNPQARLCFMGEAPGADEDKRGEPFVGRAGQLLDKIIEACQLKREEVYILNMLKCRPPGNRNPLPDELTNCRPFLERQLELIQPEFICCLGAVSSQNLLGVTTPIGKLRGKVHQYRGTKVVCTFHPAYLLRNPAAKKDCWDDMKFLMREMGVEL